MTQAGTPRGRDLRRDGLKMDVRAYVEVRSWLNHYFSTRGHERKGRGIVESPGEQKGAGNALNRLVAWYSRLCDEDIERIQEEGASVLAALDVLPPEYGKRTGHDDPIAVPRRTATTLRDESMPARAGDPVAAAGDGVDPAAAGRAEVAGRGAPLVRGLVTYAIPHNEGTGGDDLAIEHPTRQPVRRR